MTITQLLGLCTHLPGKAMIITQQPDQNTPVLGVLMTTILQCGQSSRHPKCPMTITHLHDQATAQRCQTTSPLPRQEVIEKSPEFPQIVLTSSTRQSPLRKKLNQPHFHPRGTSQRFTIRELRGKRRRWLEEQIKTENQ